MSISVMTRIGRLIAAGVSVALSQFVGAQAPENAAPTGVSPERQVYFGDLHLHTAYSFDTYPVATITPGDAYRFARGEPVRFLGQEVRRTSLPLDFIAVTDHSEYIGVFNTLDAPGGPLARSEIARYVREHGSIPLRDLVEALLFGGNERIPGVDPEQVKKASRSAWQRVISAANENYRPGTFTTFIAYEWSAMPGGRNLHRNVIFRGDKAPDPFTAIDSVRPEDLWAFLEMVRRQGYEALAIPHNSNASDGLMFASTDSSGKPIDAAYAKLRSENEPLAEISQIKGQSETHPVLSPNDEFADFEIFDRLLLPPKTASNPAGSYLRDALGRGLVIAGSTGGVDPFKYGFVGASDIHNGLSESAESWAMTLDDVALRAAASQRASRTSLETYPIIAGASLTGVWAEENTRESIFAALRRRETFATSGTRLRVRLFGGWNYSYGLFKSAGWVATAYRTGVPMGADLPARPAGGAAPSFAVWAAKDPDGANLDRVQIVKVWLEHSKPAEKIFDAALSDGRTTDRQTGKAPAVGSTVDMKTATYTSTVGATELAAVWRDPDFDPNAPAVYYVRVLETPTPRWSTILAVKRGERVPEGGPAMIQERGWSSPIWYTPRR